MGGVEIENRGCRLYRLQGDVDEEGNEEVRTGEHVEVVGEAVVL